MHSRVIIDWEKEPNEKNELTGIAQLHVFDGDCSFANSDKLLRHEQFRITVNGGCFGMEGIDGKNIPEMSEELRGEINTMATSYWKGWMRARSCCLWKLEPDAK